LSERNVTLETGDGILSLIQFEEIRDETQEEERRGHETGRE
jgi:hypothetical protein